MNILKRCAAIMLSALIICGLFTAGMTAGSAAVTDPDGSAGAGDYNGNVTLNADTWVDDTPVFQNITLQGGYVSTSTQSVPSALIPAYCAEPAKLSPINGSVTQKTFSGSGIIKETSSLVLNVLYYGFNGPGFNVTNPKFSTGGAYPSTPSGLMKYFRARDNLDIGYYEWLGMYTFTHYAVAYAKYGADAAFGTANGEKYRAAVTYFVTKIREGLADGTLPNQKGYVRAYLINCGEGYQKLIFPVFKMRLRFNKVSTNPAFTNGNSAYSLNGAQFILFTDKAAAQKAAKYPVGSDGRKAGAITQSGHLSYIQTDSNGNGKFYYFGYENTGGTATPVADIRNYYVIEYNPPTGYAVDNKVYGFVDSGETTSNDGMPVYEVNSSYKTSDGSKKAMPNTPKMVLKLTKRSSDTTITAGNSCYSLEGAEYTVYTDSNCRNKLSDNSVIVTDSDGNGSYLSGEPVDGQELWAKETKASPGYALDEKKHKLTFSGERDQNGYPIYTFTSIEKPDTDPITVLLQKYDATTGRGTNTEKLAGAEFAVKFYPAYYSSVDEIGQTQPLRSWVFKTDEDGYLRFDARSFVSGDAFWYDEGRPTLPYGTITIEETKAPTGYQLNPEPSLANIKEGGERISWQTTNENVDGSVLLFPEAQDNGGLKIYKTSTDNKVSGIWFRVSTDGYSKDFRTNQSGLIVNDELSSLPVNKEYTIEELGYRKSDGTYYYPKRYGTKPAAQRVTLRSGETATVYFKNTVIPSELQVVKTSDDGKVYKVYFSLRSSTGTEYPLLVTDRNGSAKVTNLPIYDDNDNLIRYTVEELGFSNGDGTYSIPEHYATPAPQTFTLVESGATVTTKVVKSVSFHNSNVYGYAKVLKTDSVTGERLPGCTFGLYSSKSCAENKLLDTCVTGSSGTGTFNTPQLVGTYYVKEIEAAPGYCLSTEVKTVKISASNNTKANAAVIEAVNVPTETVIHKTDITGSQEIEGATLTVAKADNLSDVVDEWISTEQPHTIQRLERGKSYVLIEKIPAPGYVTAESITFTVNEDGSVTEVVMKDDITKIEIIKINTKKQPVAGIRLQILEGTTGNKVVVPTWTTDGNPYRVDGKLVVGKTYRLHEVSTLPEYTLADDVVFVVQDASTVQTVRMVNTFKTGSVTLHKLNSKGQQLAGSQWQLFDSENKAVLLSMTGNGRYKLFDNSQLQTLDTDANGNLKVEGLAPGEYYFIEVKSPSTTMPYGRKLSFTIASGDETSLNPEITVQDHYIVMPETGSIGIAPFYVAGTAAAFGIAAGIIIYLIIKKKKTK